jgi:hypothetical protein
MSWYDGVPLSMLAAGPPANFAAADASSSAAQSLITGATGDYYQPAVPFGFWQMGQSAQLLRLWLSGVVTGQSSATTMLITVGAASTTNTITGGTATTLASTPALTVTSLSGAGWETDVWILNRGTGYGTSTVSTSLLTGGTYTVGAASGTSGASTVIVPNSVTTIDASVPQWLYATVTFSTSSSTNSCTLEMFSVFGGK